MGKKDTKKTMANTVSVQPQNPLKKYYVIFGLLAFFLFANTLGNGYNMDDSMVTNNHKLTSKGLSAIGEIFTSPYYSDDAGYAYGYRPMVHLSFALEQELFGQKPGAGHFINVLLFVISVILFFKLLVKWVGEKNILFAAVATLLFTVHPIHTEVVASLKNRDELLAFLFVIWAGVCAFKYLEKEKISSLIAVFLLFSLAMLSKKSVYPMAIILPVSMVLLHTVPLKKNSAIALAMVLPAAIIGSDLLVERMFIMFALALAAIGSATYVKYQFLTPNNSDTTKKQAWILPVILLFIVVMASFYFSSLYLSVLAIPLFVWLLYLHFNTGLLSIILYSTALFFLFNRTAFIALPIMLALGYGVYLWKNKQSYAYWLIGALVLIIAMQFLQFNPLFLLNFLAVVVFIGLLISNILYGVGYLLLVVVGYFYFDSLYNPFLISLISILILWFIYQKTNSKTWIVLIPVVFFSIVYSHNAYQQYLYDSANQPTTQTVQ
ncbi:MAG TPA: glycosyltransferase family 39 protein, partial [Taishania sp.]|nr:glycosyltransferase family 39 protein [Taishania sp.]